MSLTLSSLTAWVKQDPNAFYTGAVLGNKTAELVKQGGIVMTGVKGQETINLIDTDAVFQADACGWASSGTTTLTQRSVTVGKVKIQEALCVKSLENYFTSQALALGSTYTNTNDLYKAIAEKYFEKKLGLSKAQIETGLWQGDTTSGTNNLSYWDGYIKLIKAAATPVLSNARLGTGTITAATNSTSLTGSSTLFTTQVGVGDKIYSYNGTTTSTLIGTVASITNATTIVLVSNGAAAASATAYYIAPSGTDHFATPISTAVGITTSNVIAILFGVYDRIPAKLLDKDDLTIFVGMDVMRKYIYALTTANLFHFVPTGGVLDTMKLHGTNVTLQAVQGLNDTNEIFALRLSNMALAVDMMDEEDKFDFFYATEAMEHRFTASFKVGVNVAFPDEVTRFQMVAGTLA